LALDAGNPKNYNAGISTNWTDKVGGNNGTLVNGTYHNDGPFVGAGYVEFDGTNDTLTIADNTDFNFGSGDYTIEMWVYPERISATQENLITRGTSGFSGFIMSVTNFLDTTNGSSWTVDITYTNPLVADKWQHIAVCRNGDTWTVYIDGVANGTTTVSGSVQASAQTLTIGERIGQTDFQGYISNLRIIKGTALYTSNFTPPTGPLTAVTNTVLLTCQGNTIADASSSAHSISVTGGAAARLGFPASAFEFDGVDDYVLASANPSLNFETGDFTVECWVNISAADTYGCIFNTEVNAQQSQSNTFDLRINTSRVVAVGTYGVGLINSSAISANTWTHIAVTRIGTTLSLYINSTLQGTATNSTNFIAGGFSSGLLPRSPSNTRITGRISNIRVLKGKGLTAAEVQQNYNALKGRYV
jgi:hypothetical protein